jgi:hypothetical protein
MSSDIGPDIGPRVTGKKWVALSGITWPVFEQLKSKAPFSNYPVLTSCDGWDCSDASVNQLCRGTSGTSAGYICQCTDCYEDQLKSGQRAFGGSQDTDRCFRGCLSDTTRSGIKDSGGFWNTCNLAGDWSGTPRAFSDGRCQV